MNSKLFEKCIIFIKSTKGKIVACATCVALVATLGIVVSPQSKNLLGSSVNIDQLCANKNVVECIKAVRADDETQKLENSDQLAQKLVEYINSSKDSQLSEDVQSLKLDKSSMLKDMTQENNIDSQIKQYEQRADAYKTILNSFDKVKQEDSKYEQDEKFKSQYEKVEKYIDRLNDNISKLEAIKIPLEKIKENPQNIKNFTQSDIAAISAYYGEETADKFKKIRDVSNMKISTSVNADRLDTYFDNLGHPKISAVNFFQHGAYTAFPYFRISHKIGENADGTPIYETWTGASGTFTSNWFCDGPQEWDVGEIYENLKLSDIRRFESGAGYNYGCAYNGGYYYYDSKAKKDDYYLNKKDPNKFSSKRVQDGDLIEISAFVRAGTDRNWMADKDTKETIKFCYDSKVDQVLSFGVGGQTATGDLETTPIAIGNAKDALQAAKNFEKTWSSQFWKAFGATLLATAVSIVASVVVVATFGIAAPVFTAISVAAWTGVGIAAGVAGFAASLAITMGADGAGTPIENVDLSKQKKEYHYYDEQNNKYAIAGFSYSNNGYYNSKLQVNYKEPNSNTTKTILVGCGDNHNKYCSLGDVVPTVIAKDTKDVFPAMKDNKDIIGIDIPDGSEVWANAVVQGGRDRKAKDHFTWSIGSTDFAGYMTNGAASSGGLDMNFIGFGSGESVVAQMDAYNKLGNDKYKGALISAAISFASIVFTSFLSALGMGALGSWIAKMQSSITPPESSYIGTALTGEFDGELIGSVTNELAALRDGLVADGVRPELFIQLDMDIVYATVKLESQAVSYNNYLIGMQNFFGESQMMGVYLQSYINTLSLISYLNPLTAATSGIVSGASINTLKGFYTVDNIGNLGVFDSANDDIVKFELVNTYISQNELEEVLAKIENATNGVKNVENINTGEVDSVTTTSVSSLLTIAYSAQEGLSDASTDEKEKLISERDRSLYLVNRMLNKHILKPTDDKKTRAKREINRMLLQNLSTQTFLLKKNIDDLGKTKDELVKEQEGYSATFEQNNCDNVRSAKQQTVCKNIKDKLDEVTKKIESLEAIMDHELANYDSLMEKLSEIDFDEDGVITDKDISQIVGIIEKSKDADSLYKKIRSAISKVGKSIKK